MSINIDNDIINQLFGYIYTTMRIKYVYTEDNSGNKIKYYNNECKNIHNWIYKECEKYNQPIEEEVYYKFKHYPNLLSQELIEKYEIEEDLLKILQTDLNNVYLKTDKFVVLQNLAGNDGRHEGSDHIQIALPIENVCLYQDEDGIPFMDFVEACFKIKSHKFDFHYQTFDCIDVCENDDQIIIFVNFEKGR